MKINYENLALGLAAAAAGIATRKTLEKSYERATHRKTPDKPRRTSMSAKEGLFWAAVSGTLVGLARIGARSGVQHAMERKKRRSRARRKLEKAFH